MKMSAGMRIMNKFSILIFPVILLACNCGDGSKKEQAESVDETLSSSETTVGIVAPSGEMLYNYMNHPDLNTNVKEYLEGTFTPANDMQTRALLDTLVYQGGELSSLYFGIFNKICKESTEELSSILGPYAIKFLENNTKFCVASLKNGAPDYFTGYISSEFNKTDNWENQLKIYTEKLYSNVGNDPILIRELNHLAEGRRK